MNLGKKWADKILIIVIKLLIESLKPRFNIKKFIYSHKVSSYFNAWQRAPGPIVSKQ